MMTSEILQIVGSSGVFATSTFIFILMAVHVTRRLTKFEARFDRVEMKLGLREANGDAEKYGKVVTVGDLMAFEDRQNKQVERKIKECQTQQGACHV